MWDHLWSIGHDMLLTLVDLHWYICTDSKWFILSSTISLNRFGVHHVPFSQCSMACIRRNLALYPSLSTVMTMPCNFCALLVMTALTSTTRYQQLPLSRKCPTFPCCEGCHTGFLNSLHYKPCWAEPACWQDSIKSQCHNCMHLQEHGTGSIPFPPWSPCQASFRPWRPSLWQGSKQQLPPSLRVWTHSS